MSLQHVRAVSHFPPVRQYRTRDSNVVSTVKGLDAVLRHAVSPASPFGQASKCSLFIGDGLV